MQPRDRPPLIAISGSSIAYAHTVLGFSAFFGALILALCLHYHQVVKNHVAGWPQEWWPSVSATIGDWPQERAVLQIFIALASGPRIALVLLSALLVSLSNPQSSRSKVLAFTGILRTLSCGGWVYCTSTDLPFIHDVAMILYLVLTPAWMFISWGSLAPQPDKEEEDSLSSSSPAFKLSERARKTRRNTAMAFFASIPCMCFTYYRHRVLEIPGAYTIYSFFEWNLIVQDLLFDLWTIFDLSRLEIHIVEAAEPSRKALLSGSWWLEGTERAVRDKAWSTAPSVVQSSTASAMKADAEEVDEILDSPDDDEANKGHAEPPSSSRQILAFLSDVYNDFLWWTTLTALHPSIFFFSVYNLAIGGHEVLLIVQVFALGITLIPGISENLLNDSTLTVKPRSKLVHVSLWALSLSSVATWWIPDPLTRLAFTGLAAGGIAVNQALSWGEAWQRGDDEVHRRVVSWLVGLALTSLAKYANHSNNPLWPFMHSENGGQHPIGLVLAVVCLAEVLTRPRSMVSSSSSSSSKAGGRQARVKESKTSELQAALGMGSLLFALHTFLTDSGTMIAWGWTGYPVKGPMAIPHGWLILTYMSLGIAITVLRPTYGHHPIVHSLFALSNLALILTRNWVSFSAALITAATLPPLASPMIKAALRHHPLRLMLWSWLVADLLTFFQVLTVAYAFVPGGMPFREKTWVMLAVQIVFLGIGLRQATRHQGNKEPSRSGNDFAFSLPRPISHCLFALLTSIIAISLSISQLRLVDPSTIQPCHANDTSRVLTAGIQTVHFGLDQNFHDSTRRMSSLYTDLQLDVLGLLETDLHRSVFGNRDLTQYLASSMGMYADIGPTPLGHTWGCVLLSKFPIINSTHHLLPSPEGELAPAIHAVLDVFGEEVHVWVSHNGQEETPLDRELQTKAIAKVASMTYPHPFIFLGYIVSEPHAPRPNPYGILFEDGRIHDVEPLDSMRWCQYIGFRSLSRVAYIRVSRYTLTDTELQLAKFRVRDVRSGREERLDPDRDDMPRLVNHDEVPGEWWFPTHYIDATAKPYEKFSYAPWVYPRYYAPPEDAGR